MDKRELLDLLQQPLNPDLDYYDATASIEAMANHIRGMHKVMNHAFLLLGQQAKAIIALRKEMVEVKGDLLKHGVDRQQPGSSIIMPARPKVEVN